MKLTQKQKNGFYISLTVFLAVGLGIVVFLIVKHFRNKNQFGKQSVYNKSFSQFEPDQPCA